MQDGDGYIIDIEEGEEVPEGFPDTVAEGDQVAEITPGSEVAPDDWQEYQVSIGKGNSLTDGVSTYGGHVCGGTLIDSHAVLTAARECKYLSIIFQGLSFKFITNASL